ncbi:MAG: 16S rRNA (cytosine(967)-C(5))-methyltransferase RsmB [Gammaproteobacteria bacterium]|nr:16S rRNA (cytosine(967)-C(5))-methyltransferase RsmB [Gammaproteobacteria bacterium]
MNADNPRWIALQVMLKLFEQGRSLDDIFNSDWFRSLTVSRRDLGLSRELAYGLCRWHHVLSPMLKHRLQKPVRARDRDIEIILMMGLYQLLIMKTEAHAAVNETVKLAQAQKKKWASGLVNAVLRNVIREEVVCDDKLQARAYPDWMIARIEADWGDQAGEVLLWGNQRPPMTLRVDSEHCDVEEMIAKLADQGIGASQHAQVETAIVLESPCDVTRLPGFEAGLLSVQDAAAQIAASLLVCDSGARVLDACAAPGGKTAHLLQRYPNIDVDALDSSETRLERLRQNLRRVGHSARILVADAADLDSWFGGSRYDCILADLPCSASGVMRRHPDIKLLRRESDIMPLLAQQRKIVDALWSVLKPGGKMLYSTCSVFKDENEVQIAGFLERHADAAEITLPRADWGEPRPHGRQVLTGSHNMDGFYYALLSRIDSR